MNDDVVMAECLRLAALPEGYTFPNPKVGCVIIQNGCIIASGVHRGYGLPHAEVDALAKIPEDYNLEDAVLYVNLEPCCHHGKTPPCTDLIVKRGIKHVRIGSADPNPLVQGKGIQFLLDNGVEVVNNILPEKCIYLNRHFYSFHICKKPYITLKWAESADGFIAPHITDENYKNSRIISGKYAMTFTHRLRSFCDHILIGSQTFNNDNPQLNVRYWAGKNPRPVIIGQSFSFPPDFTPDVFVHPPLFLGTKVQHEIISDRFECRRIHEFKPQTVVQTLIETSNPFHILVEGGKRILELFIRENYFNEVYIIKSKRKRIQEGIPSPDHSVSVELMDESEEDLIYNYTRKLV